MAVMRSRLKKAPRRQQRHTRQGEAQKQRLVDAAYDIIAEEGFEGLRTREVALRANLNISTLHYYFASKEDLVRSVAERLLSEFKAAPDAPTPPGALEKLGREFAEQTRVITIRPATYVVVMELFTRSLRDPKLRPVVQELLSRWHQHFSAVITDGVQTGQFLPRTDVPATTLTLQSILLGRALILLIKGEDVPSDSIFQQVSLWLSGRTGAAGAD